jgi:hypothetical protein
MLHGAEVKPGSAYSDILHAKLFNPGQQAYKKGPGAKQYALPVALAEGHQFSAIVYD